MSQVYKSLSIANPDTLSWSPLQKLTSAIGIAGLTILIAATFGVTFPNATAWLIASLGLMTVGVVSFSYVTYLQQPAGIKNNNIWHDRISSRGISAWVAGVAITAFYIVLYQYPQVLGLGSDGAANTGLVALFDPLSQWIKGVPASQWFVYGTLYTLAIIIFGIRYIWKYRHNKYQVLRTISVMFFQTGFAFLIPELMEGLNKSTYNKWFDKDMKNMWPLDYDFFFDWHWEGMISNGSIGLFMLILGIAMIFFISPLLTYLYGKRWYCSWVCGCGGLAETAGDPFRQLSDKSLKAWKIERWVIHLVLVFVTIMTIAVLYTQMGNNPEQYWLTRDMFAIGISILLLGVIGLVYYLKDKHPDLQQDAGKIIMGVLAVIVAILLINYFIGSGNAFFIDAYSLRSAYGFYIGAIFSGIIGVGFYPLMGSRVWCRYGCPMAGLLGLQQKFFSRFRITTNGGQCISCGNCSTYCEMGIDVRSYAQKGQNIVRASCVGCGVCAAVCPRGVLRLENGSDDIYEKTLDIRVDGVRLSE